jgi:nitrile hydratase accessory protein
VRPEPLPAPLRDLPGIPLDAGSPVFKEPWEARAFAMTLALHERGVFTWPQWADALSRQITQAHAAGDADLGDTYYQHWLRALESLVKDLPP